MSPVGAWQRVMHHRLRWRLRAHHPDDRKNGRTGRQARGRAGRSGARLILIDLPSSMSPFSRAMAVCAACGDSMTTKAKPRPWPVSLSVGIVMSRTTPAPANTDSRSPRETFIERLPTFSLLVMAMLSFQRTRPGIAAVWQYTSNDIGQDQAASRSCNHAPALGYPQARGGRGCLSRISLNFSSLPDTS